MSCDARVPEPAPGPSRSELLELDIDTRLAALWCEATSSSKWSLERVAAYLRAAYARGYDDALSEAERGTLWLAHGYLVPPAAGEAHEVAVSDVSGTEGLDGSCERENQTNTALGR